MGFFVLVIWTIFVSSSRADAFRVPDILNKLNRSVDPCDNFYEFACGNYSNVIGPIPDGVNEIDFMYELHQKIDGQVRDMLEAPGYPKDDRIYLMLRNLYQGCKNIDAMEKLGLDPLKNWLNKLGGWPTISPESWNASSFVWSLASLNIHEYGIRPYFTLTVDDDPNNASRRLLTIDVPEFALGDYEYYLNSSYSDKVEAYRTFLFETAVKLGASESIAKADTDAIIQLETKLVDAAKKDKAERKEVKVSDLMTLKQITTRYKKIAPKKYPEDDIMDASNQELYNVTATIYLDQFSLIFEQTDSRTVANYLMARVVLSMIKYLAPSLQDGYLKFQKALFNNTLTKPRWKDCVDVVQEHLQWPLSYYYIKAYNFSRAMEDTKKLTPVLKEAMAKRMDQLPWMDDNTKAIARAKLSSMIDLIGYPASIADYHLEDYDNVTVDVDHFFDSVVSSKKGIDEQRNFRLLREPRVRAFWYYAPVSPSLYYFPSNILLYTASALQEPLYLDSAPSHVQYGRLGADLAMSIIAAFDEYGRFFDANGVRKDWYSSDTLAKYQTGLQCFLDQYTSVVDNVTQLKLSPSKPGLFNSLLLEDNGAVRLAYQGYKTLAPSQDVPIDELKDFTVDQLFFISYAQKFCHVIRPEYRSQAIKDGSEQPSDLRVIFSLQNFDEFSKAFKCPADSRMNPSKKCELF